MEFNCKGTKKLRDYHQIEIVCVSMKENEVMVCFFCLPGILENADHVTALSVSV